MHAVKFKDPPGGIVIFCSNVGQGELAEVAGPVFAGDDIPVHRYRNGLTVTADHFKFSVVHFTVPSQLFKHGLKPAGTVPWQEITKQPANHLFLIKPRDGLPAWIHKEQPPLAIKPLVTNGGMVQQPEEAVTFRWWSDTGFSENIRFFDVWVHLYDELLMMLTNSVLPSNGNPPIALRTSLSGNSPRFL